MLFSIKEITTLSISEFNSTMIQKMHNLNYNIPPPDKLIHQFFFPLYLVIFIFSNGFEHEIRDKI